MNDMAMNQHENEPPIGRDAARLAVAQARAERNPARKQPTTATIPIPIPIPAEHAGLQAALQSIPLESKLGKHSASKTIGFGLRHADSGIPENIGRLLAEQWDKRVKGNALSVFNGADPDYMATQPVTVASIYKLAGQNGWTGQAANQEWGDPQPLAAKYDPEPYPVDALPMSIRAAVDEVAGFVKAPLPMVASSALGALSLACQAQVDVKRAERLQGPTGLFLLIIADSGERKSTCDGFFTPTIREYENQQEEAAQPILKDYAASMQAWDARCSGTKEKIKQLAKDGKPTSEMESVLKTLINEKPEPPRIPRLLYGDVTPEEFVRMLSKAWPSGGIVSAEAGIVFGSHGMGKDSIMRNLATLNALWDGAELAVDRKTSESFKVRGARITVSLQVQEATLREFFSKSGVLARGTGFLARFLIAWPTSTQGQRPFTEAPASWPALAKYHQRLVAILSQATPINDRGGLEPAVLPFTPDAKADWIAFHDSIERELVSGGELYDVRDVASKTADNAARLAALFQMFEHGGGAISPEAFEGASRIVAWHLSESRRFFGELALPPELADAARLESWLCQYRKSNRTDAAPKNHTRQHGPLRDGKRLDAALRELAELQRWRLEKDDKKLVIRMNPSLAEVSP